MENGSATQGEGRDPSGFLSEIIGSSVTVKLNSGVVYKGTAIYWSLLPTSAHANLKLLGELQSVDGYMNIALEKTEEHVNGVKKRSYGDAFVRGNNGGTYLGTVRYRIWLTVFCCSHVHLRGLIVDYDTGTRRYVGIQKGVMEYSRHLLRRYESSSTVFRTLGGNGNRVDKLKYLVPLMIRRWYKDFGESNLEAQNTRLRQLVSRIMSSF